MAVRTLKARLEIDGAEKYKQIIKEINQENAVLDSELGVIEAKFSAIGESSEGLSQKLKILETEFENQAQKVLVLRDALKNAEDQFGKGSEQWNDYAIKVNKAEEKEWKLYAAIEKTKDKLEEHEKATKDAGDEAENFGKKVIGLGDSLDEIGDELGIKIPESAKDALNSMDGFSEGTVAKMAAAAGAVAAVYGVIKGIADITIEAAKKADALLDKSRSSGIDLSTLQSMNYANLFGDFDELTKTMTTFNEAVSEAKTGSEELLAVFERLGVSFEDADGKLRPLRDVFIDTVNAMDEYPDSAEKAEMANTLFGQSYEKMSANNRAQLDLWIEKMKEAEEENIVLSDESIESLAKTADKVTELSVKWDVFKDHFANVVAPAVGAVLDILTAQLDGLIRMIDGVNKALDSVSRWLSKNEVELNDSVGYYVDDYNPAFGSPGKTSKKSTVGRNASGNVSWRGGYTYLAEGGPELYRLPQGTRIYNAQETRDILSGGQTININVQGINQLDEIVRWYESRQIRARMA